MVHLTIARQNGSRHGAPWTEEESDYVRQHYEGNNASARRIGQVLGRTAYAVKGQVQVLGIATAFDRQRQNWDPVQDEQLMTLLEKHPPRQVARKMHRSVNSIVLRAKRLGVSSRDHSGWYTSREVCEILGKNHKWVKRRIVDGLLVATSHYGGEVGQAGLSSYKIQESDLKDFIRRYPEELNGRNVDLVAIVEILAGIKVAS